MKKEIEVGYIPEMDRTIIFENIFDENGDIKSSTIVGWYFGGPDEELMEEYRNGNIKAEF